MDSIHSTSYSYSYAVTKKMSGLIIWEDSKAGNYDLLVWSIHITGPVLEKSAL
jgi:hypothetical protein